MGILKNQLQKSILGLKGSTPGKGPGALPSSKLHNLKSITRSSLDLDGVTPSKYSDNKPV
jgi:hypothetical protein|tara:strand:- start:4324 stop:4503 length:180 start_codon:yes stop_codon:yes gene_type:complete